MRDEIERFVASLRIPAARKAVVLAELLDHANSAAEAARRRGAGDAAPSDAAIEAAVREAMGDLEAMRASYESVEAGFGVSRRAAFGRGIAAAAIVAVALDQGASALHALGGVAMATAHAWTAGIGGAVFALVIAAVFAPPRLIELLRAELRAPRVHGRVVSGVPIGPAVTYLYTVLAAPVVVWMGMIVVRAIGGNTHVDAPLSAFAISAAVYGLLAVEGMRARRERVAG